MTVSDIIASSTLEVIAMAVFIWGYANKEKVIAFEIIVWSKFKRWLRRQLRKSDKIVAWAEKPTKHGRPDADFIEGQVKVYGDVWR
jgi:hypothetical protein